MAQIITLANIKGGVGKTSATVNLAYLLGKEFGKRVLVIDADDQGNSTKSLGIRGQYDLETETLWHALNAKQSYKEVAIESPYKNVWVIPATKELRNAQVTFGQSARGIKLFQHLIRGVDKDFDVVLVDTKPQINILLQASLAASHWYLIPSFPESDSYDGFVDLVSECEEIHDEENPSLHCLGVLFTCIKKCPAHDAYLSFIRKHLKSANVTVLMPGIHSSNALATGTLQSRPAVSLPNSTALKTEYTAVAKAIIREANQTKKRGRPKLAALGINAKQALAIELNEISSDEESVFS
jgi:chromosome partitioning protein